MPQTITIPSIGDTVVVTKKEDMYTGKTMIVWDSIWQENQWLFMLQHQSELNHTNCSYTAYDLELPLGTCPACKELVFHSLETDGPVWTCPRDLSPSNPYWQPSDITEDDQARNQIYSYCYEDVGGYCGDHMPLHSACYEKGEY